MSQLVDAKLIKNLANTLELKDASTDACRLILSDVELKLRNVIKESIKYMRHFNREKMTNDDINCALKDLGQENKLTGMQTPFVNKYQLDGKRWGQENKETYIKDEFNTIEVEFKAKNRTHLNFDWIMINGKVPQQSENSDFITKQVQVESNKKALLESNNEQSLRIVESRNEGTKVLIKEIAPNILSKESEKFLTSFFKILEEQVNLIDFEKNQLGFTKFQNVLDVIQKNPSLQILSPFIVTHINNNYKSVIINGALKKNLYVMILDSMFRNPKINLEYQNHIIIKILDSFITCPNISMNVNRDEQLLRENAAKLLAKLVVSNDDSRYPNLKPHLFNLLSKKLMTQIDSFKPSSYPIVHAIQKFFSYMDSVTIKNYLMDLIFEIMDKDEFLKMFYSGNNYGKVPDQEDAENAKMCIEQPKPKRYYQNREIFDINIIYESFLLCIEKILQQLFFERGVKAIKIYENIYEKQGETVQPIIMRSMLNFSKNFKSGLMSQINVRRIMGCYAETAYNQ